MEIEPPARIFLYEFFEIVAAVLSPMLLKVGRVISEELIEIFSRNLNSNLSLNAGLQYRIKVHSLTVFILKTRGYYVIQKKCRMDNR